MNVVSNAQYHSFANFDLTNWPLVIVTCNELKHNDDFIFFLQRLEGLGKANQKYSVILDARNASNIGLSNAYSAIGFIKRIKDMYPQCLQNTILIYNNSYLYYLLNIVLTIQKPVCKFYTYKPNNNDEINYKELFALRDSIPEKIKLYN
tara:strand:- start:4663 stop:5109 length:447 start_codon:yes stop_codon:yes gene_type:complete